MTDIVERLRAQFKRAMILYEMSDGTFQDPLRSEAGDEIERLREALRGMENAFVLLSKAMQTSEIGIPLDVGLAIVEARDAARAALSPAPSKGGDDAK